MFTKPTYLNSINLYWQCIISFLHLFKFRHQYFSKGTYFFRMYRSSWRAIVSIYHYYGRRKLMCVRNSSDIFALHHRPPQAFLSLTIVRFTSPSRSVFKIILLSLKWSLSSPVSFSAILEIKLILSHKSSCINLIESLLWRFTKHSDRTMVEIEIFL